MGGISTGMLGFILSLVGMECTYIGGTEKEKNRAIFIGSLCHTTSGTKINSLIIILLTMTKSPSKVKLTILLFFSIFHF